MPRRNPYLWIHEYCCIKPYVIYGFLNEFLPPGFFNIVFKFNTYRAVIPGVCESAVNFRTGVDYTSALAKSNYFVHRFFCIEHLYHSFHNIHDYMIISYTEILCLVKALGDFLGIFARVFNFQFVLLLP